MALLFDDLVSVGPTVDMMVDHARHLACHIVLVLIQDVMVDQSHLGDAVRGWVLSTELIVEVELVLGDLAIFKVFNDL